MAGISLRQIEGAAGLGATLGKLFGTDLGQQNAIAKLEVLKSMNTDNLDYKQAIAAARKAGLTTVDEMFTAAKLALQKSKLEDAEEIIARIDAVRDDPEFDRHKSRDIGDLPDSLNARIGDWVAPAMREASSFDGSDYKPMSPLKRTVGEFAIALWLAIGSPAEGAGTNPGVTDAVNAGMVLGNPDYEPTPSKPSPLDVSSSHQGQDPRPTRAPIRNRDDKFIT